MSTQGRPPVVTTPLDPVEQYVPLLFRIGVYAFLTVFLFQAIDTFARYIPGNRGNALLWIVRTFTFLPLHEGGHFLFRFFGRTLYVLGGSFWQIMFPFLWFIIAVKERSQVAPFPLFWTGENMMDVSLYMRDAPVRFLPLLGGDKVGHRRGRGLGGGGLCPILPPTPCVSAPGDERRITSCTRSPQAAG